MIAYLKYISTSKTSEKLAQKWKNEEIQKYF